MRSRSSQNPPALRHPLGRAAAGFVTRRIGRLSGGVAGIEGLFEPRVERGIGRLSRNHPLHPAAPKLIARPIADLTQGVALAQDIGKVGQGLTLGGAAILRQGGAGGDPQGCGGDAEPSELAK